MVTKAEKRELLKKKRQAKRASLADQLKRKVRTKKPKIKVSYH